MSSVSSRDRLLQPLILPLQILELLCLIKLQTAVVPAPSIITLLRNAQASANHTHCLAWLSFTSASREHADNLFRRIPLP